MQVTELESKGLKKSFKIVVEAAQINTQMEVALKDAGQHAKIPGFRPGFIPMKVLKQRYGKSVQNDVLKHTINQSTTDVINQRKLRPAMTPQINIEDYKEEGDLAYTMTFELFPEVPDVSFDKMKLVRKVFEVDEKEIDEAVKRIAESSPRLIRAKEGAKAALGQVVSIDFKGMLDGKAFDGGSASDFNLELGSGQFIEGFEEQLVGTKEGDDKLVTVTFPKDYPSENLAGKEATFSVKVKEIHGKETPEIDDVFAKARGFVDARALREAVRNQIIKEYDGFVRNQLKKQLFDELENAVDFALPTSMVELEFNAIWSRLEQAKQQGDEEVAGKTDEELKTEFDKIARRRVKLGILLAEIGNRHKIQVTRDELGRAVMQQASQFTGQEKKVMEFYQKNPDRVEDLRGPILEEKVVDYILSKVKYDDQKVTIDQLMEQAEEEGSIKKKSKSSDKKDSKAKKKKSGE